MEGETQGTTTPEETRCFVVDLSTFLIFTVWFLGLAVQHDVLSCGSVVLPRHPVHIGAFEGVSVQ